MANFTPAFADEADKSNADYRLSLKFTFPDGVKLYSDVALGSRLSGDHDPYVLDWGDISDAAGDRSNAAQVSDWVSLRIADPEEDWLRRGHSYELRGTPVELTIGVVELDTADFFVPFRGILLDWKVEEGAVTVQCGPSFLLQLLAPFPEIRLTLADFLELPDEFVDIYAPIGPYGRHDGWSFGKANKGSSDGAIVPVYVGNYTETNLDNVEITGSKYIIGVGRIKSILTAFRDSVPITSGFANGNWKDQAIYEVINGVTYSRIMFASDTSESEIAVDVEGYETIGDGTGDLITNQADQILHFLTNFGFGRYKTGLWLSPSSVIDPAYQSAVAAYLASRMPNPYVGGRYIEATTDRGLVMDEIDQWCASSETKSVFTVGGKLGFGADSFDDPGDVDTLPWLRWQEDVIGTMRPTLPSAGAAKRIIGESGHSQARGDYGERLMIVSPTAVEDAADNISRPWGPAVLATDYDNDIEGLMWWLKPQNLRELEDGEPVTLWQDEGGGRFDLFQRTPGNEPTYVLDAVNGFPAISFNGVDQWLDGPDGSDIIHIAHGSQRFGLFITDIDTEQTIFQAGSSARLWIEGGQIHCSNNGDSEATDITTGWHVVARQHFGNLIRMRVDNPVSGGPGVASGNNSGFGDVTVGAGPAGVFPFNGMILEIASHQYGQQQQSLAKIFAHGMRNAMTRGDTTEQEREASSRRGVGNERSRMFVELDTPLWPLNYDLLQPFALTHPDLPYPVERLDRFGNSLGRGGGVEKWARRLINLVERVHHVGRHTMSLGFGDRTGVSHLARYSGVAEFTHTSRREGIAASGLGVRRIFTHLVPLYVKSPAGFVEQVLSGLNYGLPDGELQDASAKPLLLRTSFQSGLSGITVTAGSGSVVAVNILDDGAPRLFGLMRDPQAQGISGIEPITEQLARFTAGNPHSSDTKAAWPVSVDHVVPIISSSVETGPSTVILTQLQHGLRSGDEITIAGHTGSTPSINGTHVVTVTGTHTFGIAVDVTVAGTGGTLTRLLQNGDALCLSVDIRGDGGPLHFEAVNEDGDFWDNTNKSWSATPVLNPFPLGDADEITRVRSEPIVWDGTSGQLSVTLLFPAGEVVVDGVVDVYHVGLEDNPFPSSRMPQDDTYLGERPAPALTWIESDSGGRYAFNEPKFTVAMRLTSPWNELDLQAYAGGSGIDVYLWKVCYEHPPDNNFWAGGFDASEGQAKWFLMMRNDTNEDTAIQDTDMPVRGTEIALVWRLAGADGDWGLPPHTMQVIVNGVPGTPFTIENVRPVPIGNARIEWGLLSAFAKDIRFDWRTWSLEEAIAWSLQ